MDDDLSMDSFVDIVANTVGIVIILTMLTIAGIDRRNLEVDTDLRDKMRELSEHRAKTSELNDMIVGASKKLKASGADLGLEGSTAADLDGKSALETATALIKRMGDIQKKAEEYESKLDLARRRREDVKASHAKVKQDLASLRARKKELSTAAQTRRKKEAQLATALPGLNMSKLERTPLTSMKQEVKKLESDIAKMEDEAKIGREEYNRLKSDVEKFRKQEATIKEQLANLQEVANLDFEIPRPPSLGEQMKLPVFLECFSKPSTEDGLADLRVRFLGPGPQAEGEHYRSIADAASKFGKFLAEQTEEFKASRRLHFIVRPDAGAAFRQARRLARAAGWTVGWNPIGKDVPLDLVPSTSETTAASSPAPSVVTPR